jgi:hypothetical protein
MSQQSKLASWQQLKVYKVEKPTTPDLTIVEEPTTQEIILSIVEDSINIENFTQDTTETAETVKKPNKKGAVNV